METLNVEHLKPLYADSPHELVELINETVSGSAALIESIERDSESHDAKAADSAHELKGVCGTTGARELAAIAADIEEKARDGDWDGILGRIGDLRAAHRRLVEAAGDLRP